MHVRAVEFIEQTNQAATLDQVAGLFKGQCKNLGFEFFAYSIITDSFPNRQKYPGLLHNYPDPWIEYYRANHYIDYDPVFERGRSERGIYLWTGEDNKALSSTQRKIISERQDAGIRNGYTLFIHGPGGSFSAVTMSNGSEDFIHNKALLSSIYLTMHQFNLRCMDFVADMYMPKPPALLSQREREVLLWCSQGKSNNVIASILGLSEKTIDFYLDSIFKKLKVNNRTVAVLKAISLRLIAP